MLWDSSVAGALSCSGDKHSLSWKADPIPALGHRKWEGPSSVSSSRICYAGIMVVRFSGGPGLHVSEAGVLIRLFWKGIALFLFRFPFPRRNLLKGEKFPF